MAVPKPLVRAGRALSNGLYRASGARLMGKVRGMPVLLITLPGRTTGDPHTTPVLYFDDDGKFLLLRAPFFADYQRKVERQIPMAILTPTPHAGS